ncbi:MAG: hypothetical protein JSR93_01720, partial [Verrucomicrobia bacterium]|nr:hypothetical protein [Verrucomicrobiota bacterium]
MPHYNLNNNQSLIPSSSQQPVIPSQGPLERPPISIEMQLMEAVERDKAATVYSLLQEVVEPTTRRNAYLLAYHLGHINAALVLLNAGVPLIGTLETLAYNAISQQKYDVVSFDTLSAYIREHGLSFNPDSRHGPKQESLQECATRTGTRLALTWLDQFRIDSEGVSNQNGLHQPQLGLQDPISSLDNFDDPWGFLTGPEAFEQDLDLDEFPNLLLHPSDLDFDHTLQPNIPAAPLVSSSAQSLNESSNSTPANFIDLT